MHLSSVSGDIGIDIVLDSGEYYIENDQNPFQLDLAYARAADYEIDITSETDAYQIKLYKEACTQFMDLAAFYGMHANGAGELKMDDGTGTALTTAADIYTKITPFYTKNNLYIYIQANRQRSYNFYENYEHSDTNFNTLNIGGTDATMAETTFGTLGWPIHVFSEVQDPGTNVNTVCFQLTTDNLPGSSLYIKTGVLTSEHEIGFVRGDDLLKTPSSDPAVTVDTKFSKSIESITPSSGANTIASILDMVYEGKVLTVEEYFASPPANAVNHVLKDIDDIFGLIDAKPFKTPRDIEELPTVVDEKLQIVNFPKGSVNSDIGTVKIKKVEDKIQTVDDSTFLERVTYESLLNSIRQDFSPHRKSTSSAVDSSMTGTSSYGSEEQPFYQPSSPYFFQTLLFMDKEKTITGLMLNEENGNIQSKKILGLIKSEFNDLNALITSNNLTNTKLFFLSKSNDYSLSVESDNKLSYQSFVLGVAGENNSDELKIYFTTNEIEVYTIDGFVYATKAYAESTPQIIQEQEPTNLNFGPWMQE